MGCVNLTSLVSVSLSVLHHYFLFLIEEGRTPTPPPFGFFPLVYFRLLFPSRVSVSREVLSAGHLGPPGIRFHSNRCRISARETGSRSERTEQSPISCLLLKTDTLRLLLFAPVWTRVRASELGNDSEREAAGRGTETLVCNSNPYSLPHAQGIDEHWETIQFSCGMESILKK